MYRLLKEKNAKVKVQDGCLGFKIDAGKRNNTYFELYP